MGAETIALIRERVVEVLAQPDMKLKLRRNNLRQLHSPETRVRPFMSHQTHLPCLFQTAVALCDTQVALGSAAEAYCRGVLWDEGSGQTDVFIGLLLTCRPK